MESRLFRLFDYQKFEGNKALQQVIDSTHMRCMAEPLSMEDMEWVNAAGQPEVLPRNEEKDR